jgi:hypothetical protein
MYFSYLIQISLIYILFKNIQGAASGSTKTSTPAKTGRNDKLCHRFSIRI